MPIRITGMNSGLDTEALVTELVSAYRKKTEKYTKAQTKLSWKQEAWKSLNTKITGFQSKLTSLRFSSAYNVRSTTVSDTTKASVKASSSAINGTYSIRIEKQAKGGYLTGAELDSKITENSTLAELGFSAENGTISVGVEGKTTDIKVTKDMKVSEFVTELNNAGVKASFDASNHRIFVASEKTGKDSDFTLTGTDVNGKSALVKLGLSVESTADTASYKAWAAYASYGADGKYDAAATEAKITTLLESIEKAPTTITNKKAQIEYANAYKNVNDTDSALTTERDKQDLKTLIVKDDLTDVYIDKDGNLYNKKVTENDDGNTTTTYVNSVSDAEYTGDVADLTEASKRLNELEVKAGLATEEKKDGDTVTTVDTEKRNAYVKDMKTIAAYEDDAANEASYQAVQTAYANGTLDTEKAAWQAEVDEAQKVLDENALLDNADFTVDNVMAKITNAVGVLDGSIQVEYSKGATRVDGLDAIIYVNNAKYTSTTNELTVNGMTINALAETGNDEITVTVATNTQGLYDKVKDILKDYNELINEMTKLYNASSAKGYEPLTDEEKDAMSDTEIEKWEEKIKDSLLRRDDTLGGILNDMTTSLLKSYSVNGKNYSLSSFGIHTLGVLYSADNEENALHIDGNEDDPLTSGNADKLMAALTEDPDTVIEVIKQSMSGLYDAINKRMSASTISSFNVVYNDKEMAREYSDYTTTIKKWEEKLTKIEDSYYRKFAAMESALAVLQSQQSQFASMLGM